MNAWLSSRQSFKSGRLMVGVSVMMLRETDSKVCVICEICVTVKVSLIELDTVAVVGRKMMTVSFEPRESVDDCEVSELDV